MFAEIIIKARPIFKKGNGDKLCKREARVSYALVGGASL